MAAAGELIDNWAAADLECSVAAALGNWVGAELESWVEAPAVGKIVVLAQPRQAAGSWAGAVAQMRPVPG